MADLWLYTQTGVKHCTGVGRCLSWPTHHHIHSCQRTHHPHLLQLLFVTATWCNLGAVPRRYPNQSAQPFINWHWLLLFNHSILSVNCIWVTWVQKKSVTFDNTYVKEVFTDFQAAFITNRKESREEGTVKQLFPKNPSVDEITRFFHSPCGPAHCWQDSHTLLTRSQIVLLITFNTFQQKKHENIFGCNFHTN